MTRGACGMRPLNHGLTVWRSDDATSIEAGAISARMWLATTMSAVASGALLSLTNHVVPLAIAGTSGKRDRPPQSADVLGSSRTRREREVVRGHRERRVLRQRRIEHPLGRRDVATVV